ncbi:hypothetical protein QKO73_gp3 [Hymenopteran orino-related virus OKIAV85]|uniref:Uncharacterized protein n=1 Tax=Hymenopteran orino-related virus OKIAV85 TaxID=2789450 RepID=A0A7U3NUS3_9MONO|nr:hypothetical protein QKO73_gp3 [Hymenopteran orino-related virus OKIAV85]QPB73976.1 hypothetical protein [Hymenopteran orino-related virus OKIAV85]
MRCEYLVHYELWVSSHCGERGYPFIVKIGTTKRRDPPVPVFSTVEYALFDSADKRHLLLCPRDHHIALLKAHDIDAGIQRIDLTEATGAAKWELTGEKTLVYIKETLQPEEKILKPEYITWLQKHGHTTSSTYVVPNSGREQVHYLPSPPDYPGPPSAPNADELLANSLHRIGITSAT